MIRRKVDSIEFQSGAMIRSLLDDRKKQMRLTIEPQPENEVYYPGKNGKGLWFDLAAGEENLSLNACPYSVGDVLPVKEPFFVQPDLWSTDHDEQPIHYSSDVKDVAHIEDYVLQPAYCMPRWASRLQLKVTGIHVGRLQDMRDDDALAEGVQPGYEGWHIEDGRCFSAESPVMAYAEMDERWDSNPWVWITSFDVALEGSVT